MSGLSLKRRLSDWLSGSRAKTLHFEASEYPESADVEKIRASLVAYNNAYLESTSRIPVAVFVRDDVGRLQGGATGMLAWEWLQVELLWVDESLRGDGIGARLLAQLERLALSRGIYRFRVETTSFQALEFYKQNGYELFSELQDCPPGHTDYGLRKIIDLSGAE